jgi:hypothetical protein
MDLAANVLDFVEMFLIATDSDKFAMCGGRNDYCIPPRVYKNRDQLPLTMFRCSYSILALFNDAAQ